MAACFAAALAVSPAGAQDSYGLRKVERVHLDDVYPGPDDQHVVELYLRTLTRYGEPISDLQAIDLLVREDDDVVEDFELHTLSELGRGMTCVIAIDTSKTMKGEPFKRARAAALEFMELLESRDRVAVVAFSDEARVVVPFTESRATARVKLEQLDVDSQSLSTVFFDGVHKAVELIRSGRNLPRRSFVIVFSDGKDAGSRTTLDEVISRAKGSEIRSQTLVFSIGYARFGTEGLEALRQLSDKTGGDFLQATSTIHLNSFFNEIWKQMMESYVVRFESTMDGEQHRIETEVEGHVDSRTVRYPDYPIALWPYLLAVAAVVLVGLLAFLLGRNRSAGRLVFSGGPRAGEVFSVKSAKISIGALPDNDIVIPSKTVSRFHAAVYRKGREVQIEDLNSSNGTFVNGNPIRICPLKPGDKIRIADVDLVFER